MTTEAATRRTAAEEETITIAAQRVLTSQQALKGLQKPKPEDTIFSSSFPPEPFNATKHRRLLQRQAILHRSLRFATALAVAMSNCSRKNSMLLPSSSALPCMQVQRSRLSESQQEKIYPLIKAIQKCKLYIVTDDFQWTGRKSCSCADIYYRCIFFYLEKCERINAVKKNALLKFPQGQ